MTRWPVLAPYLAQEIIAIAIAVENGSWWDDDERDGGGFSDGFQPSTGD